MINKSIFKIFAASISALLVLASCDITKDSGLVSTLGEPVATAEVSTHEMTISWEPVKGADTYVYMFDGQSSVSTTATSLQFTDLMAGTDYSFAIKAVASDGSSLSSKEASKVFTTLAEDIAFKASLVEATLSGIKVKFEGGKDIYQVDWYLGSEFTYAEDYAAFATGETTQTLIKNSGEFTVTTSQGLQIGEPSVIFVQGISNEGVMTDIVEIKATAAPVTFEPSYISTGSFVATVKDVKDSNYSGMGFLSASQEEINYYVEAFGMPVEDIFMMFEGYGMVENVAPGESFLNVLNGEPGIDHYIGLFYYGADQAVKELSVISYTSGDVDPSALSASVSVSVDNITESSADICFKPGAATCGYVYRLFTNEDFESFYAKGEDYGYVDPLDYIRSLADAYGSRGYKEQTDSRTSLKVGTQYVLATFPYNVNGTQGWGKAVITRFATIAPVGATAFEASASVSEPAASRIETISKLLGKIAR